MEANNPAPAPAPATLRKYRRDLRSFLTKCLPEYSTRISDWSSCPGHNEFPTRAGPSVISGAPTARFCRSDEPACCCVIDFSDTAPTLLLGPNLQPQSVCYPLGTGRA